jgi:hypothetical protein
VLTSEELLGIERKKKHQSKRALVGTRDVNSSSAFDMREEMEKRMRGSSIPVENPKI